MVIADLGEYWIDKQEQEIIKHEEYKEAIMNAILDSVDKKRINVIKTDIIEEKYKFQWINKH